jgi:hypothetical protein
MNHEIINNLTQPSSQKCSQLYKNKRESWFIFFSYIDITNFCLTEYNTIFQYVFIEEPFGPQSGGSGRKHIWYEVQNHFKIAGWCSARKTY